MAKVILIAGEPATGKTTLVCEAFHPQKMQKQFAWGLLKGHTEGKIFVGGVYDGSLFAGTDKLSMAVQPHVLNFLRSFNSECTLVMEGDRVANAKFLEACGQLGVKVDLIVLRAHDPTLVERHLSRGDQQSERWLLSRRTKVHNLCEAARPMPHVTLHEWSHENQASLAKAAADLQALAVS